MIAWLQLVDALSDNSNLQLYRAFCRLANKSDLEIMPEDGHADVHGVDELFR